MTARLPSNDLILSFRAAHGDRYDYSLVEYVSAHTKVRIICKEHGVFEQTPKNHRGGSGCPKCRYIAQSKLNTVNQAQVLESFRAAHGDRYDYSQTIYKSTRHKVTVICREHGAFDTLPGNHAKGSGCPKCGKLRVSEKMTLTLDSVLAKFKEVHGEKYDYSRVIYSKGHTPVEIICPEHGLFMQSPASHAGGRGCPRCGSHRVSLRMKNSTEVVLAEFAAVHGGRYDYSSVRYAGASRKVEVICPKHGPFWQTPTSHRAGNGCSKCAFEAGAERSRKALEDVIADFRKVHGDRYDYDAVNYTTTHGKVEIRCRVHGAFVQIAKDHMQGAGCPKCVDLLNPKANQDIATFVGSLGLDVQRDYRFNGDRRSIDVFVAARQVGVEHNGLTWHSERYHANARQHMLQKKRDAEMLGIRLLHIMEDEWRDRRSACELLIKHALGVCERVNARDCRYEERRRGDAECEAFLNANHIQGAATGDIYGVLIHDAQIVMVMSIDMLRSSRRNRNRDKWELTRMASSVQVRGGATKLMTNLLRNHPEITHLTTYCDRRLFDGRTYGTMGFVKTFEYGPDYTYVVGSKRQHKSNYQKARIAERFGVDMTGKTERQAMEELGFYRIWDCGKSRYEWHK